MAVSIIERWDKMSNLYPKTTSENVTRPNGKTAEASFTDVPEILMNAKMEKSKTYTLSNSIDQFRYLLIMYASLSSLYCMNTMLVPVNFIEKGATASNQFNMHCRLTETSYSYAQIGFTNETTLKVGDKNGSGNYPDVYVKICGIR